MACGKSTDKCNGINTQNGGVPYQSLTFLEDDGFSNLVGTDERRIDNVDVRLEQFKSDTMPFLRKDQVYSDVESRSRYILTNDTDPNKEMWMSAGFDYLYNDVNIQAPWGKVSNFELKSMETSLANHNLKDIYERHPEIQEALDGLSEDEATARLEGLFKSVNSAYKNADFARRLGIYKDMGITLPVLASHEDDSENFIVKDRLYTNKDDERIKIDFDKDIDFSSNLFKNLIGDKIPVPNNSIRQGRGDEIVTYNTNGTPMEGITSFSRHSNQYGWTNHINRFDAENEGGAVNISLVHNANNWANNEDSMRVSVGITSLRNRDLVAILKACKSKDYARIRDFAPEFGNVKSENDINKLRLCIEQTINTMRDYKKAQVLGYDFSQISFTKNS